LGDRTVLFKYLNPNLLTIAYTTNDHTMELLILDAVSGAVLYHTVHDDVIVDDQHSVHIVMSEHWIVYTFSMRGTDTNLKGAVAVVLELYESAMPDDRVERQVSCMYQPYFTHIHTSIVKHYLHLIHFVLMSLPNYILYPTVWMQPASPSHAMALLARNSYVSDNPRSLTTILIHPFYSGLIHWSTM
jgi:hypothetical protein